MSDDVNQNDKTDGTSEGSDDDKKHAADAELDAPGPVEAKAGPTGEPSLPSDTPATSEPQPPAVGMEPSGGLAAAPELATKRPAAARDLERACEEAAAALQAPDNPALLEHGDNALSTLDTIATLLHQENSDIASIIEATREDLLQAYVEARAGRSQIAAALLRGTFEGLFTSLLYRQQTMSLRLWAADKAFDLAHQMLDPKHTFYHYYKLLFEDERYSNQYGRHAPKYKKIIAEAVELYDILSSSIHKKRARKEHTFPDQVERVLRIALTFLEREDDLPTELQFPTPLTFPALVVAPGGPAS